MLVYLSVNSFCVTRFARVCSPSLREEDASSAYASAYSPAVISCKKVSITARPVRCGALEQPAAQEMIKAKIRLTTTIRFILSRFTFLIIIKCEPAQCSSFAYSRPLFTGYG